MPSLYLLPCPHTDSVLTHTQELLGETRYQQGLALLGEPGDDYRSELDWLHATLSPSWKAHILGYYDGRGERLIDIASPLDIRRIDMVLSAALRELCESLKLFDEPTDQDKDAVLHVYQRFFPSLFPEAPARRLSSEAA